MYEDLGETYQLADFLEMYMEATIDDFMGHDIKARPFVVAEISGTLYYIAFGVGDNFNVVQCPVFYTESRPDPIEIYEKYNAAVKALKRRACYEWMGTCAAYPWIKVKRRLINWVKNVTIR